MADASDLGSAQVIYNILIYSYKYTSKTLCVIKCVNPSFFGFHSGFKKIGCLNNYIQIFFKSYVATTTDDAFWREISILCTGI